MRNVTITLEDSVAEWSRIWAAQHQTSVSRMLGEFLAEKMAEVERYTAAMESYLALPSSALSIPGQDKPYHSRDAAHER